MFGHHRRRRGCRRQRVLEALVEADAFAPYERVWWFAASEAIRRRLTEAVERERMSDFVRVEPLPDGIIVSRWG